MRVLLVGATGPSGTELLKLLGGHEVTALVRSERTIPGATVITGNAKDRADLARAVEGQDAVISALGSKKVGRDDLQKSFLAGITAAMESSGTRRLISVTPWGVGASRESAPLPLRMARATILRNQVADREAGESIVDASSIDFTHVRAGMLGTGPARGGVVATSDGRGIGWRINRADVAAFMVAQLEDTAWLRAAPIIGYR